MINLINKYVEILNSKDSTHNFSYIKGRKYYKIVETNKEGKPTSAHSFVDFSGNLYKAANWNTPAKGIRYNLNTDMELLEKVADVYTSYLYKHSCW